VKQCRSIANGGESQRKTGKTEKPALVPAAQDWRGIQLKSHTAPTCQSLACSGKKKIIRNVKDSQLATTPITASRGFSFFSSGSAISTKINACRSRARGAKAIDKLYRSLAEGLKDLVYLTTRRSAWPLTCKTN
jgi:hypothetical protein